MAIKRVLVTGSSGTIGTHLVQRLLEKGFDVRGIDIKPNVWSKEIQERTTILDLRDPVKGIEGDFDLVVHLAANARVHDLVIDPSKARDNFETLFNVLEFVRINNIPRIIFSSSREVYGNSNKLMHHEDEAYVKNCESPYTASKIGGEALVHSYQQCYGLDIVIVRFSNVYGMYDTSNRVIPLFISRARNGEDLKVFGKDKLLDFTYISDAVDGTIRCIENFEKVKNNTLNIASGKATSLLEVAQMIKQFLNSESKIILDDVRTGEVVKYVADISKARELLGYEPNFTVVEGVQKSVEWYADHPEAKISPLQ